MTSNRRIADIQAPEPLTSNRRATPHFVGARWPQRRSVPLIKAIIGGQQPTAASVSSRAVELAHSPRPRSRASDRSRRTRRRRSGAPADARSRMRAGCQGRRWRSPRSRVRRISGGRTRSHRAFAMGPIASAGCGRGVSLRGSETPACVGVTRRRSSRCSPGVRDEHRAAGWRHGPCLPAGTSTPVRWTARPVAAPVNWLLSGPASATELAPIEDVPWRPVPRKQRDLAAAIVPRGVVGFLGCLTPRLTHVASPPVGRAASVKTMCRSGFRHLLSLRVGDRSCRASRTSAGQRGGSCRSA